MSNLMQFSEKTSLEYITIICFKVYDINILFQIHN